MYEKYLLQLEEAGKIRNLKERSINCYKNYVSYFLNYMEKHPEELTCRDVRDFLLAKKDNGLKATTLNLYNSAIRFFYRNVLHVLWDDITVPRMIIEHKLPTVLSTDEIDRLLDATDDLKYKAMFATMYSSGMRVSEVIHLHYDDISRTNMQIHVRDTKNRMDRYTILSERNLALLTEYWFRKGRPKGILFPNQFTRAVSYRKYTGTGYPTFCIGCWVIRCYSSLPPSQFCHPPYGAGSGTAEYSGIAWTPRSEIHRSLSSCQQQIHYGHPQSF